MSDLKQLFDQAKESVNGLTTRPSNEDLLNLYALFKQATSGDVEGKRPGMIDVKGRAKYDYWAKIKGMSTDDAMQSYIEKVKQLGG